MGHYLKFTIVIEQDDSEFHAYCPAFKGLHVGGDTQQEAFKNAKDAIKAYLDSYQKHGEPLPIGPDLTVERYEKQFEIPNGAFLRHVTLLWPTGKTSGTR